MLRKKIEYRHPTGYILSICGSLVRMGATRGGDPCGIRAAKRTPDYANQSRVRLIVPKKDLI